MTKKPDFSAKGYAGMIVPPDEPGRRTAVLKIPAKLGLAFTETHLQSLDNATESLFMETHQIEDLPSLGQLRVHLDEVMKRCDEFCEMVYGLDIFSRELIGRELDTDLTFEAAKIADKMHDAALWALGDLPSTGKWPKMLNPRHLYIQRLAMIFLEATSKRAEEAFHHRRNPDEYYGSFYFLVHDCFHATGEDITSNTALGKEIDRSIKELKELLANKRGHDSDTGDNETRE